MIIYKNKKFKRYKKYSAIKERISKIAIKVNKNYKDKEVVFIGVLNGSIPFMMDFIKHISCPFEFEFMKISSYSGMKQSILELSLDISSEIVKNKHIIIVEDIIDSGKTIKYLKKHFKLFKVKSLSVISLLVRQKSKSLVDFYCFELRNNKYVIGYGMDCNNLFRNLNDIYRK